MWYATESFGTITADNMLHFADTSMTTVQHHSVFLRLCYDYHQPYVKLSFLYHQQLCTIKSTPLHSGSSPMVTSSQCSLQRRRVAEWLVDPSDWLHHTETSSCQLASVSIAKSSLSTTNIVTATVQESLANVKESAR